MQQKFQAFQAQLNKIFLEREEIIETSLVCLLAGEHCLFLGAPGTAKSQLARAISDSIDGSKSFEWLLTRFSTPEELYGPVSLQGLQNDKFTRILSGKLPESNIAFLDEIFKASSAILNSLLTIINERVYHNNGQAIAVPLLSLFGASNELPQAEDLSALFDRFLVKHWISYCSDGSFVDLLTLEQKKVKPVLTLQEIEKAQKESAKVKLSQLTIESLIKLRVALNKEEIAISDRKWRQSIKLIKASAYLAGRKETNKDDISVLKHVLWASPDQIGQVKKIVASIANPCEQELLDLQDKAKEVFQQAQRPPAGMAGTEKTMLGAELNTKLKKIGQKLHELAEKFPGEKGKIEKVRGQCENWNKQIVKDYLEISI